MAVPTTTIFAEIHTLFITTLTNNNFQHFATSKNMNDLIIKLANTSYRQVIDKPIHTNKELSNLLDEYYKKAIKYFESLSGDNEEIQNILEFIKSEYQIDAFIYLLTANKKINNEELGFFETLNSFLYLNSLDQLFELSFPFKDYLIKIKNNSSDLKIEFGSNFRAKNNLQQLSLLLKKLNLEEIYKNIKSETLKRILRNDGDRMIIDVLFSLQKTGKNEESKENINSNYENIQLFFPFCTNFSDYQISQILNLKEPSIANIKDILSDEVMNEQSINSIGQALFTSSNISDYSSLSNKFDWVERKLYLDSFDIFNDISCIYSYLKIRENEINNIKYISECIEAGKDNIQLIELYS